jgi:hypothetical protein
MCDTLKKEVKVTSTGQIQRESGVDQFIRKSFSVFQNFNIPLCGNIYACWFEMSRKKKHLKQIFDS